LAVLSVKSTRIGESFMIIYRVLALSLLLASSMALARVQLHTLVEVKNSKEYGNHNADITFQIDLDESLQVDDDGNVKLMAELQAERESNAGVKFTLYVKNMAGEYEKIFAPFIVPNYTEPAMVSIGSHKKGNQSQGESFTITVEAQKV
jgi:hypothetical protein